MKRKFPVGQINEWKLFDWHPELLESLLLRLAIYQMFNEIMGSAKIWRTVTSTISLVSSQSANEWVIQEH